MDMTQKEEKESQNMIVVLDLFNHVFSQLFLSYALAHYAQSLCNDGELKVEM